MLLKVKFPMELFILTRVYTALINLGYSLIAYIIMLFVFQVSPKWTMLFSPLIILFLFLFSLGISYMLATAYVFFGDGQAPVYGAADHLDVLLCDFLPGRAASGDYPGGNLEQPALYIHPLHAESRDDGGAAGAHRMVPDAILESRRLCHRFFNLSKEPESDYAETLMEAVFKCHPKTSQP